MGTDFSPQRVHEYRCQSTESSGIEVSGDRGIIGIGVSPHRVKGHKCQFTEGSCVLVSIRSTDETGIEVCNSVYSWLMAR